MGNETRLRPLVRGRLAAAGGADPTPGSAAGPAEDRHSTCRLLRSRRTSAGTVLRPAWRPAARRRCPAISTRPSSSSRAGPRSASAPCPTGRAASELGCGRGADSRGPTPFRRAEREAGRRAVIRRRFRELRVRLAVRAVALPPPGGGAEHGGEPCRPLPALLRRPPRRLRPPDRPPDHEGQARLSATEMTPARPSVVGGRRRAASARSGSPSRAVRYFAAVAVSAVRALVVGGMTVGASYSSVGWTSR